VDRGSQQVPDGGPVGLRRQHRAQVVDVEVVPLVGQLLHQLEAPLLPHAEVHHAGDDALGRGAPQPGHAGAPELPAAQGQQPRQLPHRRALAHALTAHEQDRRRRIAQRQLEALPGGGDLPHHRRQPPAHRLLHQLLGQRAQHLELGVVLLVGVGQLLAPLEGVRDPGVDVLLPLAAEVVQPVGLLTQQRGADLVAQRLGGQIEALHQHPPAEARQHHAVRPRRESARDIGQPQRHPLAADHRHLLHQRLGEDGHIGLAHLEALVPQVALEILPPCADLGQLDLQLAQHLLLVAAVGRRLRRVEEAVPPAQQDPGEPTVAVGHEVHAVGSADGHHSSPTGRLMRSSQIRGRPSSSAWTRCTLTWPRA